MGCVQGKCCGCGFDCCCYCRRCWASDACSSGVERRHAASGDVGPLRGHLPSDSTAGTAAVPSHGFCLQYSSLSLCGYYPDTPDRENQDAFCIKTNIQGHPNVHFFGIFDGHGQFGTQCARFVRDKLVDLLSADPQLVDDPKKAYNSAFLSVNSLLHESEIDDSMSGTTAITVLVNGDSLFVANVGDSRAVVGIYEDDHLIAEDLSHDQTPFRKDEYERVRLCGARVLSVDQVEGMKDPDIQSWGDEENDEGDPPRLWMQNAMYPGTAFTRSVGDSTAESIGVIAVPEVMEVKITPNHLFFVLASDGIFEFLSSQAVVDMVGSFKDPSDACSALAAESYKKWLEHESRTDDITVIVVHIKDLSRYRGFYGNITSWIEKLCLSWKNKCCEIFIFWDRNSSRFREIFTYPILCCCCRKKFVMCRSFSSPHAPSVTVTLFVSTLTFQRTFKAPCKFSGAVSLSSLSILVKTEHS